MSKKQGNLGSFFGVPKEKRIVVRTTTQAKLPFARKTTVAGADTKPNNDNNDQPQPQNDALTAMETRRNKENTSNHTSDDNDNDDYKDALMDTTDNDNESEDERVQQRKRAHPATVYSDSKSSSSDYNNNNKKSAPSSTMSEHEQQDQKRAAKRTRKNVIDDDSEDDEKDFEPKDDIANQQDKDEYNDDDEDDVMSELSPTEKTPRKTKPTTASAASSKPSTSKKKSELAAQSIKSNEELLLDKTATTTTPVPYSALCHVFEEIEGITSRLDIQQLLTNLFRRVLLLSNTTAHSNDSSNKASDLYQLIYLASNTVAPAFECVELGIGDSILIKAIGEAYGTNPSIVKQKYKAEGDLGSVAKSTKGKQKTLVGFGAGPKPLLARDVLTTFREIAATVGSQSQKYKVDLIKKLLVRAQGGAEAKYIIRGLQGKLRIGLAQSTVLISLAHALTLTQPQDVVAAQEGKSTTTKHSSDDAPEEARVYANPKTPLDKRLEAAVAIMKRAYSEVPSYDALLDAALSVPLQEMYKTCTLKPGLPVTPMLAKPTKSIQEVLKRLNGLRFTCEFKYDGERAQVHMTSDGTTKVFSRSLLDTSEKFPEVPLYVKEACAQSKVESFVLDTEVVAFKRETGQFVPFQVLSTRKKTEESAETAKVQVIVQAFDLMYLNGKSLLNATLAERRELLKEHFKPIEGKFQFATSLDHKEDGDTAILEEFLETAVKSKCEGLMVKTLDENAAYEPSRRSLNWLKLKKDYLEGLGDSVDLVPLGAYHGRGKRTGVYGAYLLACYDSETEEFQSVCKIGTGFSEEDLKDLTESLKEHIIPEKSSQYNVSDALICDVWFDAVQVWEVKAADLSKSSAHRGAVGRVGEPGRGIGLRFPRFERIRPDKRPFEATSSEQILELYYQQDSVAGGADNDDDDEGI